MAERSTFRRPLVTLAAVSAVAVAAVSILVAMFPFWPIDADIERAVQKIDLGFLTPVFAFYSAIGGQPWAIVAEVVLAMLALSVNFRAWRFLVAGPLVSAIYFVLSTVIARPRPSVPAVLFVTESPARSSYPSGHVGLFIFYAVTIVICVGYAYLPRRWLGVAWIAAALFVALGAVSRIYSGAHWPSDVLGALLIGVGWVSLVVSIRWISDPLLQGRRRRAGKSTRPHEGARAAA